MQNHRARNAAMTTGLALLLGTTALVAPEVAGAQEASQPAPQAAGQGPVGLSSPNQSGVVDRIAVTGAERIETATVLSYLPLQVGDTVDSAKIDLALKALFRTDLFADVRIGYDAGTLTIAVVENPIINRVIFEGNKGLKEDKIRDEVSVRPRGIFTRAKAQSDVQRIVELYRRSGRISANVTPEIIELPQKRVDLIFKIDEGPKSGILSVNILGNKAFSDNDLRDVIVTKQSRWYRILSATNSNYDPDRIEYDKEQLRKHYRNRGYYDFRVASAIAELATDKNGFAVTYTVEEGRQYRFGKIGVETELAKLDKNVLRALVPFRPGQIYQDEKIEQATDALTFAAGAAGFAFVDVRPRYTPDREKGVVDVTFDVKEGPRVYVDRIDIVGNSRTLDYVIRREMNVAEGDAYNRALVDRSKMQVQGLGFFKSVDITEVPGSAPDRTGLQVKVEEQPTGELSFSAGYSSIDKLVIDLGISERNFRGRGEDVRARVSLGSLRQQVDLSFTQPRFLQRDMQAGIDAYYYIYDLSSYLAYKNSSIGGNIRLGFPLSLQSYGSLRYTLRSDKVEVNNSFCDPTQQVVSSSICAQQGSYVTSSIGYGLRLDKRNNLQNPTRGYYMQMNQDFAGLGGDVQYIRSEGEGGWYYGFNADFILSLTGSAGYITGWGGDSVRINDRFYKGGDDFRGFEIAGIGPRDLNLGRTDSLGGKVYAVGTVELTVPTFLPEQYGIKAAIFSDIGTLGKLDAANKLKVDTTTGAIVRDPLIRDNLGLRASAGVSVFWKSPMGPIRLDFSRVLKKEAYDRTELFRFSTSTRF